MTKTVSCSRCGKTVEGWWDHGGGTMLCADCHSRAMYPDPAAPAAAREAPYYGTSVPLDLILCEETGFLPVNGACPQHKGDACLMSFLHVRDRWHEALDREDKLRAQLAAAREAIREIEGMASMALAAGDPGADGFRRGRLYEIRKRACAALGDAPEKGE